MLNKKTKIISVAAALSIIAAVNILYAAEKKVDITNEVKEMLTRDRIVKLAYTFIDVEYMPGGDSSEEGFDCSGLTQHIYAEAGIKIPRKAVDQYKSARLVKSPKKGDLVFFNTHGLGPTHVGIYIGKGKFIHAPGIGKHVKITNVSKKYWAARFAGYGRYNLKIKSKTKVKIIK